jgi:4,5:9,10-diseco-3-hydroxy-5,9,17-trioxoandrosta-1(10),2-diene-4-oate hydrolase
MSIRDLDAGDGLVLRGTRLGSGEPVVFLHGSGPGATGVSNFARNAAHLAEAGYESLMLDSLGYGASSKPTDVPYTLPRMAGAALRALDALALDRVTLVGNSQGGAQALWIALHHPDRVKALVLMAPGGLEARETYMELSGIRSMARCLYGPEGMTRDGLKRVLLKQVVDPSWITEDLVDERWAAAQGQPLHVFRSMEVPDLSERLGEVRCPVLAFWGMEDVFCPPSGATKIARAVPNARVVLLPRCGHWVMVERAELFDRYVLDFLENG